MKISTAFSMFGAADSWESLPPANTYSLLQSSFGEQLPSNPAMDTILRCLSGEALNLTVA